MVVVVVVVRTIHSDSLIYRSLKVISKQIQKNLKLKSDVYITKNRSLLKYGLSEPNYNSVRYFENIVCFPELDSNHE